MKLQPLKDCDCLIASYSMLYGIVHYVCSHRDVNFALALFRSIYELCMRPAVVVLLFSNVSIFRIQDCPVVFKLLS